MSCRLLDISMAGLAAAMVGVVNDDYMAAVQMAELTSLDAAVGIDGEARLGCDQITYVVWIVRADTSRLILTSFVSESYEWVVAAHD